MHLIWDCSKWAKFSLTHLHLLQREHSKSLQDQLEAERNLFHEKQKKDIGSLKEQLQV